jgi:hypothetical protein
MGFECRRCGQWHDGLPFSYGAEAPTCWRGNLASDGRSALGEEQCVVAGQYFFVRARIVIPVVDGGTEFDWGVWVSLSEANFDRMTQLWTTPGREQEPPYFAWLSTEIPVYQPTTLNLKTNVHTQSVGRRPVVELEPTEHPLAVEQRDGITVSRVQEIAEHLLHPQG